MGINFGQRSNEESHRREIHYGRSNFLVTTLHYSNSTRDQNHAHPRRGGFEKERGDFWPHTSCLLQYSTKLSQSKKEALKIANRTRLTNTASCCLDVAGRLSSFFLSIQFSIFINHCSILISLEALLAVYYCGRLL